jgi:hypothetical protein
MWVVGMGERDLTYHDETAARRWGMCESAARGGTSAAGTAGPVAGVAVAEAVPVLVLELEDAAVVWVWVCVGLAGVSSSPSSGESTPSARRSTPTAAEVQ